MNNTRISMVLEHIQSPKDVEYWLDTVSDETIAVKRRVSQWEEHGALLNYDMSTMLRKIDKVIDLLSGLKGAKEEQNVNKNNSAA